MEINLDCHSDESCQITHAGLFLFGEKKGHFVVKIKGGSKYQGCVKSLSIFIFSSDFSAKKI